MGFKTVIPPVPETGSPTIKSGVPYSFAAITLDPALSPNISTLSGYIIVDGASISPVTIISPGLLPWKPCVSKSVSVPPTVKSVSILIMALGSKVSSSKNVLTEFESKP